MRDMMTAALLMGLFTLAGCESTPVSTEKAAHCVGCAEEECATCEAGEHCEECADKNAQAKAMPEGPTATIEAKGMGCPLCASSADRRLMKVDGVQWTNIDLGKGVVTVGLDPQKPSPSPKELQDAIRDAGFTAESVTMPAQEEPQ